MGDVMVHYKLEILKRRKKIKNLVDELGLSYSRVSRIINGYDNPPANFDKSVQNILKKWDEENCK